MRDGEIGRGMERGLREEGGKVGWGWEGNGKGEVVR